MIHNFSMFGKIIFMVTVNCEITGIQVIDSLEKFGRMIFGIVSPTDDFETITDEITSVARLLQ